MAKKNGTKKALSVERFIPCQVEPGMFRGEYLVYMKGYSRDRPEERITVQMFADEREVVGIRGEPKRRQPVNAWVKVSLYDKGKGQSRVILPQAGQPVGESMLVDNKDLRVKPED